MSLVETLSDVNNTFLSRRELTLNFKGLGGKLKKLEAIDMVTKEFKLGGKIVIPIKLTNHVGKPEITGTFYVYEDEKLAKKYVNPVIFSRLEKAKKKESESASAEKSEAEGGKTETKAEEVKEESKPEETKSEEKPAEDKKEEEKSE